MHTHKLRPLALLAAISTLASASIVVHETIDQMARRVPLIVRGHVTRSMASWDDGKRTIWTWTELAVTDAIKGKPGAVVMIKSEGGEVDGIGQAVSGAVTFREGEDCVLFLAPAPLEKDTFMVAGMSAGKVLITQWQGLPAAIRDTSGLSFARPASGKIAEQVRGPEFLGSPDEFIKHVRSVIAGGAK